MALISLLDVGQHVGRIAPPIVLYIGPDVFLPITSALAAAAGFVLMFWQRIVSFVARAVGRGRSGDAKVDPPTHQN
jgi:hypothetical protein